MNIAIDCRYIGKSGIGRVCSGIIDNLDYSADNFFLIGNKSQLSKYDKATVVEDNSEPYSISGLFSFDKTLNEKCDALIIPNFLIPFGVKIPVYTVMHDLMFLEVKETTKGFVDRIIKKLLLKRCMKKSKKISCVSKFTLNRCRHFYGKLADKCFVNYNGLSKEVLAFNGKNINKEKNLVFVGNVKKHKGLKTLVEAYKMLPDGEYKLKIIGEKEKFLNGMDVSELTGSGIEFTGKVSDEELFTEVAKAEFLIQPSLYEGFGLPPLEALYIGTKPIVSDIEVFKEVYEDFDVEFFAVGNAESLKEKILSSDCIIKDCRKLITEKYSYNATAEQLIDSIKKNK